MLKNRIIRAVLPREAVPLLENLIEVTGWEPGRIIAAGLAELAVRFLAARKRIEAEQHQEPWN